ncbi:hypothetical protein [Spiroplasma endosymbiont of Agriotes lineatus]|uniref:hypothetical protein n=1 Tax=Spiroplasma endosymbiont of Agriotes lineatus TaxID=3077930 RepID=UPI0030CE2B41
MLVIKNYLNLFLLPNKTLCVPLNSWIKLYKDGNHQELVKNIRNVAKNELNNKDIKTN